MKAAAFDDTVIPFGFQYYRYPTPTADCWADDLRNIAAMGFNAVKFWVQWRVNHPEPDSFDFTDIDRLMDLAYANNLSVTLNVIFDAAPAWFYRMYPESKMITATGERLEPTATPCRQAGGAPGPCFHHPEASKIKSQFLAETVNRYKDHPALQVWDLWNEPELTVGLKRDPLFANQVCYCNDSIDSFQRWLQRKYGTIERLNGAWLRPYKRWADVEPPRAAGIVNDFVDWRQFFADTLTSELRDRIAVVRSIDPSHPAMCHTVPAPIFNLVTCGSDDFELAEPCDWFGNSLGSSAWSADLMKSAAKGKKLINSEIHALPGMMALKPNKLDWRTLKKHVLIPLSKGVSGFLFWQYRPERLGIEAPAWGSSYMDGSPSPWLLDMKKLNDELQANRMLFARGDKQTDGIALLVGSRGQLANFGVYGHLQTFTDSVQGFYEILDELNYQIRIFHEKEITREELRTIRCLVMPYPLYMSAEQCDAIREWVAEGGTLIAECSFAAIQQEDGMHSLAVPGYGFDRVFGGKEKWIHSTTQLDHSYHEVGLADEGRYVRMRAQFSGQPQEEWMSGSYYKTELELYAGTEVLARYEDDTPAATLNRYGQGHAIWIGTLFGAAYRSKADEASRRFVKRLLERSDIDLRPSLQPDCAGVRADLVHGEGGEAALFVRNTTNRELTVRLALSFVNCALLFDECRYSFEDGLLTVTLPPDDIQTFALQGNRD